MPFIVFEGLDGSGKSTLIDGLYRHLQEKSAKVIRTREPGGTTLGDEIRKLILRTEGEPPTARTELLLYEASRSQHVDNLIRPHLEKGYWVLCDRFTASSIAFQSGGRSIATEKVHWLNNFAADQLKPHLTVLLDLSEEQSKKRRQQRELFAGEKEDRIEAEKNDFHRRVRESFLEQAELDPEFWFVLNAEHKPEVLLASLMQKLQEKKWLP